MPAPVNAPLIKLHPDSKLAKALKRMALRQQLLQKFHSHRITLEELNQQLLDAGILMTYLPNRGFAEIKEKEVILV